MRELLSHSLVVLRNWRLTALHLVGNAALLTCAALWLLVPEARLWQLAVAALSAVVLLFLFLWLHAGTLAYASDPGPGKLLAAFRGGLRGMGWLLVGLAALFTCMWVVAGWSDSLWQTSGYLYSKAPSALRPLGGNTGYRRFGEYLLTILFWYILPGLLLPVIAAKVTGATFRQGLRTLLRWRYWLVLAFIVLVGVWLPELLLQWKLGAGLSGETASLAARFVTAYAIATAAWLSAAGILSYFVASKPD